MRPTPPTGGRPALVGVLTCVLALGTACGGGGTSTDGADLPTKHIAITVSGDTIDPNGEQVDVSPGQQVELDVTADAPGEIHVHSDPEHQYEYQTGSENHFTFDIPQPGQVDVESHTLDKTIMTLVVQ